MANYSIRDLENFTGIKAHTLRIWEKRYKIVEPKRTETNIRYYTDEDLKRLLNVSILNRNGYKISNIVNLSEKDISQKILSIALADNDFESQIESLVLAMIDIDEHKFNQVFNNAVVNFGFENTVLKLIYPFYNKIGILWQIGTISPAQEHFISNLIRQKLIAAISALENTRDEDAQVFALFMPEGDYHELGLIFYHYLLKKKNYIVIYLGGAVPIKALKEVAEIKKVDYLVSSLVNPINEDNFDDFVAALSSDFPDVKKIFLTGLQTENITKQLSNQFEIIESAVLFKKRISELK